MNKREGWNRRSFLKAAGVSIGLPFFPSLFPRCAWADGVAPPRRLLFMSVPLGFVPNPWLVSLGSNTFNKNANGVIEYKGGWFPEEDGPGYKMPEVHADLEPHRQHLSFLKGLTNKAYRGDPHYGDDVFLTCADTLADGSRAFSNTVSCDQVAAKAKALAGDEVRHPSLAVGIRPVMGTHTGGLSWSEQGVPLAPESSPRRLFERLFGKDDLSAEERLLRLKQKRSVLDATLGQIEDLHGRLNASDRRKLEEVTEAVRQVEAQIQREERWVSVRKPETKLEPPSEDIGLKSALHAKTMLELIHAAFLTDSTRIATCELPDNFMGDHEISRFDKHSLNHAAGDPEKVNDHLKLDRAMSKQVAYFIDLMTKSKGHDDRPLLFHALAAYGSGVWGPNHWLRSLPVMLIGHAGGKIKQGLTRKYDDPTPMANLWLSMLQASGVTAGDLDPKAPAGEKNAPLKKFADSTGVLDGLLTA